MCNNKFEAYKNYGSYQFSWLRTGNFRFAGKGGGRLFVILGCGKNRDNDLPTLVARLDEVAYSGDSSLGRDQAQSEDAPKS